MRNPEQKRKKFRPLFPVCDKCWERVLRAAPRAPGSGALLLSQEVLGDHAGLVRSRLVVGRLCSELRSSLAVFIELSFYLL